MKRNYNSEGVASDITIEEEGVVPGYKIYKIARGGEEKILLAKDGIFDEFFTRSQEEGASLTRKWVKQFLDGKIKNKAENRGLISQEQYDCVGNLDSDDDYRSIDDIISALDKKLGIKTSAYNIRRGGVGAPARMVPLPSDSGIFTKLSKKRRSVVDVPMKELPNEVSRAGWDKLAIEEKDKAVFELFEKMRTEGKLPAKKSYDYDSIDLNHRVSKDYRTPRTKSSFSSGWNLLDVACKKLNFSAIKLLLENNVKVSSDHIWFFGAEASEKIKNDPESKELLKLLMLKVESFEISMCDSLRNKSEYFSAKNILIEMLRESGSSIEREGGSPVYSSMVIKAVRILIFDGRRVDEPYITYIADCIGKINSENSKRILRGDIHSWYIRGEVLDFIIQLIEKDVAGIRSEGDGIIIFSGIVRNFAQHILDREISIKSSESLFGAGVIFFSHRVEIMSRNVAEGGLEINIQDDFNGDIVITERQKIDIIKHVINGWKVSIISRNRFAELFAFCSDEDRGSREDFLNFFRSLLVMKQMSNNFESSNKLLFLDGAERFFKNNSTVSIPVPHDDLGEEYHDTFSLLTDPRLIRSFPKGDLFNRNLMHSLNFGKVDSFLDREKSFVECGDYCSDEFMRLFAIARAELAEERRDYDIALDTSIINSLEESRKKEREELGILEEEEVELSGLDSNSDDEVHVFDFDDDEPGSSPEVGSYLRSGGNSK